MKYILIFLLSSSVYAETITDISKKYISDPSATIQSYRGKVMTFTSIATSINKGVDQDTYVISIEEGKARLMVKAGVMADNVKERLWKERSKRGSQTKITFKAAWTTNRSRVLYFTNTESVSIVPKKAKGKKKKRRRNRLTVFC